MKLAVIAIGSLKERYYREACAEYLKRMSGMQPVDVIELREEFIAAEKEPSAVERALEKEGKRILSRLHTEDLVVALASGGTTMDSVAFAGMIDPSVHQDKKRCVFIIGSSHGLGQPVFDKCDRKLSFGPMTFPHELARVMLLEQLYRGQMIRRGSAYHK